MVLKVKVRGVVKLDRIVITPPTGPGLPPTMELKGWIYLGEAITPHSSGFEFMYRENVDGEEGEIFQKSLSFLEKRWAGRILGTFEEKEKEKD